MFEFGSGSGVEIQDASPLHVHAVIESGSRAGGRERGSKGRGSPAPASSNGQNPYCTIGRVADVDAILGTGLNAGDGSGRVRD